MKDLRDGSSIGDGGFSAFLKNCAIPLYYFSYKWFSFYGIYILVSQSFGGKLYVLPIESAFEYSLLSIKWFFTFCAHILNSHIAWHSRKITGSVTFSENRKSMMSFHRDFPVSQYHSRVILNQK